MAKREKAPKAGEAERLLLRSGVAAVEVIVSLMQDCELKPELRLKAAESILDRTFGKKIAQEAEGGGGGVIRFEGELDAWSL
ncbi:MAG: hypothetical protein IJW51_04855 [Clostridia bacterium]|nr:hypothetical protein [Clostridia bacterium]MBQ9802381.1 hypothetical protein [Clostridia bacterium]